MSELVQAYKQQREWSLNYHPAGPVASKFHRSEAFVKGIRGPVGSGKSGACVVEMLRLALQQKPDVFGQRRSLWVAIRNTYPELKSTTLRTFHEWVPEELCKKKDDSPITREFKIKLRDGTTLRMEVWFISCDRPSDIGKLKSINATGIWLNEASELSKTVLDMATTRIARFPAKKDGGATHPVLMMDTNSMDDDHWWYHMDQNRDNKMLEGIAEAMAELGIHRPLIEFFEQPPSLLQVNGALIPNPDCENMINQSLGAAYWLQMCAGKTQEWIDMYVLNKYGRVIDGIPVYKGEWNQHFHGHRRKLQAIRGLPIGIGMDFGLSPAAVPAQLSPEGQMLCLGEVVAMERSMGLEQFIRDALRPYLINKFGANQQFYVVGDPSGSNREQSNMGHCFKILEAANLEAREGLSNKFYPRREAIATFLRGQTRGEPNILFDEDCKMLVAGYAGRYHYRRVQVTGDDSRYQNEPYKNKWSHPCEAGQYIAMEFVGVAEEDKGQQEYEETSQWMRRVQQGHDLSPWQVRGSRLP